MTAYFPLFTLQGDKLLPSSLCGWYLCELCLPTDPYEVFICAPVRTLGLYAFSTCPMWA